MTHLRKVVPSATLTISRYTPGWSSHLPILARIMLVSTGQIMECGIGVHSTPLLHMFSHEQKRRLFSYEEDPEWFKAHWTWVSPLHSIELVTDWDKIPIEKYHWGVIFIDHGVERRSIEAIRAAKYADYVILHDTNERFKRLYHYERVYPHYRYRYIYDKTGQHSTVLSNFIPVNEIWKTI